MIQRRQWWILGLILLAAAALRLHKLAEPSLWLDERWSVMSSAGHLAQWQNMPLNRVIDPPDLVSIRHQDSLLSVWRTADVHPPLYVMLLRFWRELFGQSDGAVRGLSVLCSLAAIICLFDLGRTLTDARCALWACAIMAVAEPQIQSAQEARGYALWAALGLGAGAAAARLALRGPGWRRAVAASACAVLMLLTHFFAVASALALLIWCAIYLRGRAARQAGVTGAIALVLLGVCFWQLAAQDFPGPIANSWLRESAAGHVLKTLGRLALMPARFLAEPREGATFAAGAAAVLYLLPWLPHRHKPAMVWCGLWLICGVGIVFCIDLFGGTQGLSFIRYTLAAAPAVYLMIAALPPRNALKDIVPLLAVVGCLLAVSDAYDADWKGQWRQLGNDLHGLAEPGDLVVIASPPNQFLSDCVKLYEGVAYYCPIPCPVLLLDRPIDEAASRRLAESAHVWVVISGSEAVAGEYLPQWHLERAAPNRRFAGTVWRTSVMIKP